MNIIQKLLHKHKKKEILVEESRGTFCVDVYRIDCSECGEKFIGMRYEPRPDLATRSYASNIR